eukprot:1590737-Rhodomonas_salina.1
MSFGNSGIPDRKSWLQRGDSDADSLQASQYKRHYPLGLPQNGNRHYVLRQRKLQSSTISLAFELYN